MKITIELDPTDVAAIKKYLQQLEGIEKPSKDDVRKHIQEIVDEQLEDGDGPMSDFINAFRNPFEPG
jgi:ribosomal 50S subunit-associated protein YjgA (DUF615 family)